MDRAELRRLLMDMRVAIEDADAVSRDMLRPPRLRELGPALHSRQYREAHEKMITALAYLLRETEGDDPPEGGSSTH